MPSVFETYKLFIKREMMIYERMNMLKRSAMVSQALIWVPTEAEFEKQLERNNVTGLSYHKIDKVDDLTLIRPTKFYNNEFFDIF